MTVEDDVRLTAIKYIQGVRVQGGHKFMKSTISGCRTLLFSAVVTVMRPTKNGAAKATQKQLDLIKQYDFNMHHGRDA